MAPRHYVTQSSRSYPIRYFEGLSKKMQKLREQELELRRQTDTPKLGRSDEEYLKKGKYRPSRYTVEFKSRYPGSESSIEELSSTFRIPKRILQKVYDKGLGAWKSGGSRPGANARQWALARTYKFILITQGVHKLKDGDPDTHLHEDLNRARR